jgi:Helix-turn-helix domain
METYARGAKSFGALLRDRRRRLDPQTRVLGEFERHLWRIGKPVTQEEVAEAAGVTRVWYGMLEVRAEVNASTGLLGRLADVLMFNDAERIALFHAAIPALRTS